MADWYAKGGSIYDDGDNCKIWFYLDISGFAEGDYDNRDLSDRETDDPYVLVDNNGSLAVPDPVIELGLYNGNRIIMSTSSIKMEGEVDMDNNKIINLDTPTSDYDAATKKYVDDGIGGISILENIMQLSYGGEAGDRCVKKHYIGEMQAASTQARRYEIARIGFDKINWTNNGSFIIELFTTYYDAGGYKKYVVEAGVGDDGSVHLVEAHGISTSMDEFKVEIGSFVVISGDKGYIPIYVDIDYYHRIACIVTHAIKETDDSTPAEGYVYIIENPVGSNISSFTETDIVDLRHIYHTSDDIDTYHTFGRIRIGYNDSDSDMATVQHRDHTGNSYALGQTSVGNTVLNAVSGGGIYFRINNSNQFSLTLAQLNFLGLNIISNDSDLYAIFGRAWIGYTGGNSDYAGFGHRDQRSALSYALLQNSSGDSYLNAASGRTLYFRINTGTIMNMTASGLQLGSGARITSISNAIDSGKSATEGITEYAAKTFAENLVQPYVHIQHRVGSGINGGTLTAWTWLTRPITDIQTDTHSICSINLSSDYFTLPAGTYTINVDAHAHDCGSHHIRLYNLTDGTVITVGMTCYMAATDATSTNATLVWTFTLSGVKDLQIHHESSGTKTTTGMGLSQVGFGDDEIFMDIQIWKIG